MKYIISQSFRDTKQYLVSHAQWPIFKSDIKEAKIFDTKQDAEHVFKFWGNKISNLAIIEPAIEVKATETYKPEDRVIFTKGKVWKLK